MDHRLAFFAPQHHAVRNFVVRELPCNHGRPLSVARVAGALELSPALVRKLLDELEAHLFFLVRNGRGEVTWAFPVTTERTPHRLLFSSGERIYGA